MEKNPKGRPKNKDKFTLNELIEFLSENHEPRDIEFCKQMTQGGYISYPINKYQKHGSKSNDPDYINIVMEMYNNGKTIKEISTDAALSYNTVKKIIGAQQN